MKCKAETVNVPIPRFRDESGNPVCYGVGGECPLAVHHDKDYSVSCGHPDVGYFSRPTGINARYVKVPDEVRNTCPVWKDVFLCNEADVGDGESRPNTKVIPEKTTTTTHPAHQWDGTEDGIASLIKWMKWGSSKVWYNRIHDSLEISYTYYSEDAEDMIPGCIRVFPGNWVVVDDYWDNGETFQVVKDLAVEGYRVVQVGDADDGPWI